MVMNLVFKTDVKKTEAALNKYKEANADTIKRNTALERNAAAALQIRQKYEKEQAERGSTEAKPGVSASSAGEGSVSDPTGLVKGLRKIRAPLPEKDYDPFMGMATTRDYYELRDDYPSIRLTKAKNDTRTKAGGFDFQAYFDESLLRAFAGLGCFIDEEKAGRNEAASRELAAVVAPESSSGRISDDVL
jgi:CDK-activating kinase assembly factor MAT1